MLLSRQLLGGSAWALLGFLLVLPPPRQLPSALAVAPEGGGDLAAPFVLALRVLALRMLAIKLLLTLLLRSLRLGLLPRLLSGLASPVPLPLRSMPLIVRPRLSKPSPSLSNAEPLLPLRKPESSKAP